MFIKDIWLQFSFFAWCPCLFWYQCNIGLVRWVWKCSHLFNFLGEFENDRYYIFFECLIKFTSEATWFWYFICCLLVNDSIFLIKIGLSRFPVTSWFSFGRFCVSRNLHISSRLSNLLKLLSIVFCYSVFSLVFVVTFHL